MKEKLQEYETGWRAKWVERQNADLEAYRRMTERTGLSTHIYSPLNPPFIPVEHLASFDNSEYHIGEEPDDSHNHRCSIDHPPCPACELLEEREHEREAGL